MFDPLLGPAQIGIGHSCAVAKIQLDVGPQRVTLKHSTVGLHSATEEHYALTSPPQKGQTQSSDGYFERGALQYREKNM